MERKITVTKQEKLDDIHNRFTLAIAERDAFTEKGSDNYKVLSSVSKDILTEYTNGEHLRHGFRLCGTKYHSATLSDNERI